MNPRTTSARFAFCCLLLFLGLMPLRQVQAQGAIHSAEMIHHVSRDSIRNLFHSRKVPKFIVNPQHGVEIYEVVYTSQWIDGKEILASGLYFRPDGLTTAPQMCYMHGTRIKKARGKDLGGEEIISMAFASEGYAVIFPDYFGLGKGDKQHLYIHSETEGRAVVDMLRAVRMLNAQIGMKEDGHLFITGYSQGGHAAMATHKMIEAEYSDEFTVTASAPMSGPYDVSGIQGEAMWKHYSHPGYLPYLLFSYQTAYGLFEDPAEVFKSPYDSLLPPYFDGNYRMRDVNKVMPDTPAYALREDVVQAYLEDPDFPFRKALEANDVYNWKPEAPVLLCYCRSDEQVDYRNALKAADAMRDLGAKSVKLNHAGRKFNHGQCAVYTSLYAKMYFDSFLKGSKKGRRGPLFKRLMISLSKIKGKNLGRKARKEKKHQD